MPSFAALYRSHFRLVWSVVVRAGVAPGAREDAVQEVWLTVHRRLSSYDGSAAVASWIAGIARHVVWRQVRAVIRARRKLLALDRVAPEVVEDPMLARERMRGIEGVVAALEPMFREVFVAVEILGATGPEAAAQLGLPLNTLYSRLRLARARVHAGLDALEQEPVADPPRGLAERTWLGLAPSLGLASAAPVAVLPFAGALAAVVLGGVAAIAWPRAPEVAPASPSATTIAITPAGAAPVASTIASVPAIAIAPEAADPVAPAIDAPPQVPRRASRPEPPAVDDDEAGLLARAMEALRAGDATAALSAIASHERRFPDGAHAVDRKVVRVRALCLAGKVAQARGEASLLQRSHPDRPAVVALGEGCP